MYSLIFLWALLYNIVVKEKEAIVCNIMLNPNLKLKKTKQNKKKKEK